MPLHEQEILRGERFEFGKNWKRFLKLLNTERIAEAEKSLKSMLCVDTLQGRRFLDIGSGSGLFSLAARRLGATVYSFDYDPQAVACTDELRKRYFPQDSLWTVDQGSVLDQAYLQSLGQYDIVYSWGVLHHTGAMWTALENIVPLVTDGGRLFIAIYNDQGPMTRVWKAVKKAYNRAPKLIRPLFVFVISFIREICVALAKLVQLKNPLPFKRWAEYQKNRGMSFWTDYVDWVGGYPFEVAKPEEIFNFYYERGFELIRLTTCAGGLGNNQYIFVKPGNREVPII